MNIFAAAMASITVGIISTIIIVSIITHHHFRFIITTDIFTVIDTSILAFIIISIIHDITTIIIGIFRHGLSACPGTRPQTVSFFIPVPDSL
ncbi:unnamed protein product [Clonostachys rosea f. rosea IK726]|uniref:Uncharacterized protein n=1 Tax=Clonostachys rosea f. rosea IK726 TaxID=1349383 RepID=A0ACA9UHF1_BIOOC|nr:unnamed protein product [Clonostachys rosea f. rosea IK726]